MGRITVILKNSRNDKSYKVSMPDDKSGKWLISKLITDLPLATQDENGKLLVWKFYHPLTGKTLSDEDTLKGVGISEDDIIHLTAKVQQTINLEEEPTIIFEDEWVFEEKQDEATSVNQDKMLTGIRSIILRLKRLLYKVFRLKLVAQDDTEIEEIQWEDIPVQ